MYFFSKLSSVVHIYLIITYRTMLKHFLNALLQTVHKCCSCLVIQWSCVRTNRFSLDWFRSHEKLVWPCQYLGLSWLAACKSSLLVITLIAFDGRQTHAAILFSKTVALFCHLFSSTFCVNGRKLMNLFCFHDVIAFGTNCVS